VRAQVDQQCVINANSQFWEQMLAMALEPAPFTPEFCAEPEHMVGSVSLSGEWIGLIEVRIASRLAYVATAAMMMMPLDTVAETDALDATKEIANMIAGVIKSSLPRPCAMAVPQSAVEPGRLFVMAQSDTALSVAFRHASGEMLVRVCEQECCADGLRYSTVSATVPVPVVAPDVPVTVIV
jgi:CheY-specific phosphatase CheX